MGKGKTGGEEGQDTGLLRGRVKGQWKIERGQGKKSKGEEGREKGERKEGGRKIGEGERNVWREGKEGTMEVCAGSG